jgi:hypothetical protein
MQKEATRRRAQDATLQELAESYDRSDPHAEFEAPFGRNRGISRRHRPLHLDRGAQLDEQTVARRLNDAASMLLDLGVPQFG